MQPEPIVSEAVVDRDSVIDPDTPQLVRRAQAGDPAAFEQLYRGHVGRVYALCLRMAANSVDAEELTQDVFVRAWEMIATFRGDSAFSSWLHRLTVNLVLGRRRSDQRRTSRVRAVESLERHDAAQAGPLPGVAMDLENAIASLPAQARMVLVLHDIEGYRHHEIARLMGITPGTTKSQLHRARRLLREVLES